LGSFYKITDVAHSFVLPSPQSINYVLILTKKRLGYNLGVFFTNSSGHPGPKQKEEKKSQKKKKMEKSKMGQMKLLGEVTDDEK
jgi:hypothetical protein